MDRRGLKGYRTRGSALPTRVRARARMAVARSVPMYRSPARQLSINKQVRALIAAKKREAADVARGFTSTTGSTLSCLTSSTGFSTAASGTGLLDMDGDSCLINSVRLKGFIENPAVLDLDPVGNEDLYCRKLVVWFNKPLLVASAAGTLPPITEVLEFDTIHSQFVTAAANGGRFVVLSDKKWNLGTNTFQAATAVGHARVNGANRKYYDYIVSVGKQVKFKAPAQSGSTAGGHYDSDVAGGQIDRGLLVLYTQFASSGGNPATGTDTCSTRLNYTG